MYDQSLHYFTILTDKLYHGRVNVLFISKYSVTQCRVFISSNITILLMVTYLLRATRMLLQTDI